MDKFKISQLRDYFLKTNDKGVSYMDLSKEDLLSLAILSIFDKKGKTVEGKNYSYERPDGIVNENELNITQKEYEKAIKQIYKQLKKETDNEISMVNIPSYSDLQAMMANDKKIDFNELKLYATNGVIRKQGATPKPVEIPAKTGNNELSEDEKMDFVNNAIINHESEIYRIENAITEAEKNGTTAFDFTQISKELEVKQKLIDDFTPDNNVSYNVQDGFDGKQFNEHDQMVTRINNQAGFYEKYKYDSTEDEQYSEMMRYKPNGYKAEYWKVETLKDANGAEFKGKVQYILDEGEKIYKVVLPPNAAVDQNLVDFNSYMLYSKVLKYEQELEESRE